MEKISAALVGLGGIAWKYDAARDSPWPLTQLGAMRAYASVDVLGGCSPDIADREGFTAWSGLPAFASPAEMLRVVKPRLVGICSPSSRHFEHFCLCAEAGVRMIWLEKPPALDAGQCAQMAELARRYGIAVCVNYFRRYLPVFRKCRTLLQQSMGTCRGIHVQYSPGLARNGCHLLDLLFFLTGADGYRLLWKGDSDDSDSPCFALKLSTGQTVTVAGGLLTYHSNNISAVCDNGILSILHGGAEIHLEKSVPNPDFPGFFTLRSVPSGLDAEAGLAHYMEYPLTDLVECGVQGRMPVSNLDTSLLSLRLMQEVLHG